jgi:glucokinase
MDLIADIGATNSRCALLDASGRTDRSASFENSRFASFESLLQNFLGNSAVNRAALAIAGPITGDEVAMLNIDWHFSQKELARKLGVASLQILNDFEAVAHALPLIRQEDCQRIGGGERIAGAAMAVLGPGSGLGVAAAVPHGESWVAVSGEGGHVTVPALSEAERGVVADHGDSNGHCSAERLLSGPGLARIHSSLARRSGVNSKEMTPAAITEAAAGGDAIATETYAVFFRLLGTVAGNLALTVGARGGVYIAGGIVPRVIKALEHSDFRERFIAKGRYREYLDAIPTAVITVGQPAFLGLKRVLGSAAP